MLCRDVTIFYLQELAEKINSVREYKINIFEWLFYYGRHGCRIVWPRVVFTPNMILCIFELISICRNIIL